MEMCYASGLQTIMETIDRQQHEKKDLRYAGHLSPSLMSKFNKNESLTTNTLARICAVLNCRIEDIMEFVPDEENAE
jgi:putative transcriptional regulator